MPESPPFKRGQFYPTHLWQRCYNFNPCKRCMGCSNWNPHDALCLACEAGKPRNGQCRCTNDQRAAVVRLEQITGQPMFDINRALGKNVTVDMGSMCFNSEQARLVPKMMEQE